MIGIKTDLASAPQFVFCTKGKRRSKSRDNPRIPKTTVFLAQLLAFADLRHHNSQGMFWCSIRRRWGRAANFTRFEHLCPRIFTYIADNTNGLLSYSSRILIIHAYMTGLRTMTAIASLLGEGYGNEAGFNQALQSFP